jgi:hypothetical protein
MAKGNTKFTTRIRNAVDSLVDDSELGLIETHSGSLFSPVFRGGNYLWVKVMDSDGLLVGKRKVKAGEGVAPTDDIELLIGVVIQSEDATSQTKPNPLGKAAIAHVSNGIWIDVEGQGRRRLDQLFVLMILPEGASSKHRKMFDTAKRNVENAAGMMPECDTLVVPRGISTVSLIEKIKKKVRPRFKGRGRPIKNKDNDD